MQITGLAILVLTLKSHNLPTALCSSPTYVPRELGRKKREGDLEKRRSQESSELKSTVQAQRRNRSVVNNGGQRLIESSG